MEKKLFSSALITAAAHKTFSLFWLRSTGSRVRTHKQQLSIELVRRIFNYSSRTLATNGVMFTTRLLANSICHTHTQTQLGNHHRRAITTVAMDGGQVN
jgi:hypothetical protein